MTPQFSSSYSSQMARNYNVGQIHGSFYSTGSRNPALSQHAIHPYNPAMPSAPPPYAQAHHPQNTFCYSQTSSVNTWHANGPAMPQHIPPAPAPRSFPAAAGWMPCSYHKHLPLSREPCSGGLCTRITTTAPAPSWQYTAPYSSPMIPGYCPLTQHPSQTQPAGHKLNQYSFPVGPVRQTQASMQHHLPPSGLYKSQTARPQTYFQQDPRQSQSPYITPGAIPTGWPARSVKCQAGISPSLSSTSSNHPAARNGNGTSQASSKLSAPRQQSAPVKQQLQRPAASGRPSNNRQHPKQKLPRPQAPCPSYTSQLQQIQGPPQPWVDTTRKKSWDKFKFNFDEIEDGQIAHMIPTGEWTGSHPGLIFDWESEDDIYLLPCTGFSSSHDIYVKFANIRLDRQRDIHLRDYLLIEDREDGPTPHLGLPVLRFKDGYQMKKPTYVWFQYPRKSKASQLRKYADGVDLNRKFVLDDRSKSIVHAYIEQYLPRMYMNLAKRKYEMALDDVPFSKTQAAEAKMAEIAEVVQTKAHYRLCAQQAATAGRDNADTSVDAEETLELRSAREAQSCTESFGGRTHQED